MSGLVWCCCSSGRAELLLKKTIATLERGNFSDSLYVVVPHSEVTTYSTALASAPIHCIVLHSDKGLTRQRKYFRDLMLPGTEIVFIDDDVEAIKIRTPAGLQHARNVGLLANLVFQSMHLRGDDCLLAGVYPVTNRTWMTDTVCDSNVYVVGALYFCKNDERLVEPEGDELEDYLRQLSEQAAGRPVLRFNWIGIQTQYFKNPGGMQQDRNQERRAAAVDAAVTAFSSIITRKTRKDGTPDLRFLQRPTYWKEAPLPVANAVPAASTDLSTPVDIPDVLHGQCDLSGPEQQ